MKSFFILCCLPAMLVFLINTTVFSHVLHFFSWNNHRIYGFTTVTDDRQPLTFERTAWYENLPKKTN